MAGTNNPWHWYQHDDWEDFVPLEPTSYEWRFGGEERVPTSIWPDQQGRNRHNRIYNPFGTLDFNSGQNGGTYQEMDTGYTIDRDQYIHDEMESGAEQQRWENIPPSTHRSGNQYGGDFGMIWPNNSTHERSAANDYLYQGLPREYYLSDDPRNSGMQYPMEDFQARFWYPNDRW